MARRFISAVVAGLVAGALMMSQPAQALTAPNPTMQQVGDTTARITFPKVSGATKYRVNVTNSTGMTVYDKTSTSRSRSVAVAATEGETYTYWVRSYTKSTKRTSTTRTMVTRAPTQPITFTTYNVCVAFCPFLRPWSQRVDVVAARISAAAPDVLALQELSSSGTAQFNEAIAPIGYSKVTGSNAVYLYVRNSAYATTAWDGSTLPHGTFTVRSTRNSKIKSADDGQIHSTKLIHVPYAVLRNKATNSLVFVTDVHLASTDSDWAEADRLSEVTQIVAKVNSLKGAMTHIPQVYLGDFNSLNHRHTDGDSDYQRYHVDDYLVSKGFHDAELDAEERSASYPLSSYNKIASDDRNFSSTPPFHMDHVYLKSGTPISHWDMTSPEPSYTGDVSDHNMITVAATIDSY